MIGVAGDVRDVDLTVGEGCTLIRLGGTKADASALAAAFRQIGAPTGRFAPLLAWRKAELEGG